MTWTRLSDDFADHPDLLSVSRSARLLHVEALVYGNRHGNDGRFRLSLVARMTDADDWPELVDELLAAGVWTADDDGTLTIDWRAWRQEPSDRVQARQDHNAEKQARYRDRKDRHARGDHTVCDRRFCSSVTGNATGNETGDVTASRPVPARPVPSGGQGTETGSAGSPPADAVAAAPGTEDEPAPPPPLDPAVVEAKRAETIARLSEFREKQEAEKAAQKAQREAEADAFRERERQRIAELDRQLAEVEAGESA